MRPLDGIRIIELASYVAAPAATRLLADWGAEVIKVEAEEGDPFRTNGVLYKMPIKAEDENPCFDTVSANKKFISVNMKTPEGKEIIDRLMESADVFVTNTRIKSLVKLGYNYERIKDKFPKLIFAHVSGYGEQGPEKDTAGYDFTSYFARGGITGTLYEKGTSPVNHAAAYGDFQASVCLASGICAALYARTITGLGDKISVSLYHTAVYMMNLNVSASQFGRAYPISRKESTNPNQLTYKTLDERWVAICMPDHARHYNRFVATIGRPDLVDHPIFMDIQKMQDTGKNRELIAIIEEQLIKKPIDEWMRIFKENDISCEKAYLWNEILEDEQAWANDSLRKVQYPSGEELTMVNTPVKIESMDLPDFRTARGVGFNTNELLEEMGYSRGELDVLRERKVIK